MLPMNSGEQDKKTRLLCVDDDLRFLVVFAAVLEGAGYSVAATNDPRKALYLAGNTGFDLAILDYDMPAMNGAQLAHRLKQCQCDLPVILFSGNPFLPADAFSVVDGHMMKGENVELLLQKLREKICSSGSSPCRSVPRHLGGGF
jgi:CheY-like chemotaxis protein